MLIWKTSNEDDETPQGKQRIYFTCHADDFYSYFDTVCNLLFQYADCAVWYKQESDRACREFDLEQLDQMQLLVIPVTERLLSDTDHWIDREILYARQRHIPILPIAFEKGLEREFNKRYGGIQMLEAKDSNFIAISFEDKLKRFLSAVLLEDRLEQQIRDAFDAYIFLSYRKKDREQAQKLMRLIHANDFARDIAIWYDDFLNPGENFSEAIRAAMEKSRLFTIVVTPNLLEDGNYVMREEYPEAQKTEMPILPVEMKETDPDLLSAYYSDIPDPIYFEDESALSASLQGKICGVALKKNDSPQHIFFIGIAYLLGIDVEKDSRRALSMIEDAARRGLPEAMDKMRFMFQNGDGVEIDMGKAAMWKEKLTEYHREQYQKTKSIVSATEFLYDLLWLGQKRSMELGDIRGSSAAYEEMIRFSEEALPALQDQTLYWNKDGVYSETGEFYESGASVIRRMMAFACTGLGEIRKSKDWNEKGIALLEENFQEYAVLFQEGSNPNITMITILMEYYGREIYDEYDSILMDYDLDVGLDNHSPEDSIVWIRKMHTVLDKMAECVSVPGAMNSKADISNFYCSVADWYQMVEMFDEALICLEKALEFENAGVDDHRTGKHMRCIASIYSNMGEVCQEKGETEIALEWYQKALLMLNSLYEQYKKSEDLLSQARVYECLFMHSQNVLRERQTAFLNDLPEYTSPREGKNGNWWFDKIDTGFSADFEEGYLPIPGKNGNWWFGHIDSGIAGKTGTFGKENLKFAEEIEQLYDGARTYLQMKICCYESLRDVTGTGDQFENISELKMCYSEMTILYRDLTDFCLEVAFQCSQISWYDGMEEFQEQEEFWNRKAEFYEQEAGKWEGEYIQCHVKNAEKN